MQIQEHGTPCGQTPPVGTERTTLRRWTVGGLAALTLYATLLAWVAGAMGRL